MLTSNGITAGLTLADDGSSSIARTSIASGCTTSVATTGTGAATATLSHTPQTTSADVGTQPLDSCSWSSGVDAAEVDDDDVDAMEMNHE